MHEDLKLHPYEIQELNPQDATQWPEFVNQAIERNSTGANILFSDEPYFDPNGHVNKHGSSKMG